MDNQTNLIKYRFLAPIYDLLMGNRLFTNARKQAFRLLHIKPEATVLVVGIGTGEDLQFFDDSCQVYGIDISDDMLKKAYKKVGTSKVSLLKMNAENLAFNDDSFDVVVMNLILSVVENPNKAASEASRVLKPGGNLLVFDKFLNTPGKPSWGRRGLNQITTIIGTDINRRFSEIISGQPLEILSKTNLFIRSYQIIVLKKV